MANLQTADKKKKKKTSSPLKSEIWMKTVNLADNNMTVYSIFFNYSLKHYT